MKKVVYDLDNLKLGKAMVSWGAVRPCEVYTGGSLKSSRSVQVGEISGLTASALLLTGGCDRGS